MTTPDPTATNVHAIRSSGAAGRGPIAWLLKLFSSIWLGVILLTLLFLYCSIGSAGLMIPGWHGLAEGRGWVHDIDWIIPWTQVHIRQAPGLEMTEFEWFHWWPFDTLIALICINLAVATIRRVPFKPINYGVWMIHSGIILLAVGSVIYFSLKIEGDAPVARRRVVARLPGLEPVSMPAVPGNRTVVGEGPGAYTLEVWSVDPQWELLSGEDQGTRAYSVTVNIQSAERTFMRQLVAGYPQYTEDIVRSDDPQQPMQRAKKVNADGDPLVDRTLELELDYIPQTHVYLANNITKSWALYLREQGEREWVERPIRGLPLYNDYIAGREDVWMPAGEPALTPDPLDVIVPAASADDPLPGMDLHITSYLRHAVPEMRRVPAAGDLNPYAVVRLASTTGESREYELIAFDPLRRTAEEGRLQMSWVGSEAERDALTDVKPRVLTITLPETEQTFEAPVGVTAATRPDLPFTPVDGTDYAWRVQSVQDGLNISGRVFSLAIVEIRRGDETFLRWVFDDPTFNRDLAGEDDGTGHQHTLPLDTGIQMRYEPGQRPPPVLLVAGPQPEDLGVLITLGGRAPAYQPVRVNEPVEVDGTISLLVTRYTASSREEMRPAIVPWAQRDRDARELLSMVKVEVPADGITRSAWVRFHTYPVREPNETMRRFAYRPTLVDLPDGRRVEIILSRQRRLLPAPVVLEDFEYESHVGGFSGTNLSILNWTSSVRFVEEGGDYTGTLAVSVNSPAEHAGYWYFQAQWDPPSPARGPGDRPSAGLNYTVLGVGNRHGVNLQLFGCILSVVGMLYAFYVKPVIRRRRQQAVYARVAVPARAEDAAEAAVPEPAPEFAATNAEQSP